IRPSTWLHTQPKIGRIPQKCWSFTFSEVKTSGHSFPDRRCAFGGGPQCHFVGVYSAVSGISIRAFAKPPAVSSQDAGRLYGAAIAVHLVEPDPAEQAERYGAETPVPEWRERLVCSKRGSRDVDVVVTGSKR